MCGYNAAARGCDLSQPNEDGFFVCPIRLRDPCIGLSMYRWTDRLTTEITTWLGHTHDDRNASVREIFVEFDAAAPEPANPRTLNSKLGSAAGASRNSTREASPCAPSGRSPTTFIAPSVFVELIDSC